MSDTRADTFGDRIKSYEALDTQRRAFKGQPLIARLDGKSFHNFTKGLKRPVDDRLSGLMVATTSFLVDRFQANVGYTQSDEITLAWFVESNSMSEYPLGGRFQKLDSLLASAATAFFASELETYLPEKAGNLAMFDCRSFVVPNLVEALNTIIWRQQDCTKNAISMAAHTYFSHKSLQNMNGTQMQERLFAEAGINFNDYPEFFRRGTFVRRAKVLKPLSAETISKLQAMGRPVSTEPIERSELQASTAWLTKLEDPIGFCFKGGAETYRTMQDSEMQAL